MDQTRFDELTRTLASARSRRSVLGALIGAGAAGWLTASSVARAKRRGHHSCASIDDCHPCQTCQIVAGQAKGKCVAAADGAACGGDCGICESGHCRPHDADCGECQRCDARSLTCRPQCPKGKLCCGDGCCDRDQNCCQDVCCNTGCIIPTGECCPSDRFCAGHLCCEPDEVCCGGECVAKCTNGCDHDPDDCACGAPPIGTTFCPVLGICRISRCPRGQTFDPSTCRCECKQGTACGAKCCAAGQACCSNGCCDHACASDGSCSNCASGIPCNDGCCNPGEVCDNGTCEYCPTGKVCNGSCCFHSTDVCCNGGCWAVEGAPYSACSDSGICCPNGYSCCSEALGCCAN